MIYYRIVNEKIEKYEVTVDIEKLKKLWEEIKYSCSRRKHKTTTGTRFWNNDEFVINFHSKPIGWMEYNDGPDERNYEYLAYSMPIIRLKLLDENGKRTTVSTEKLDKFEKNQDGVTLTFNKVGDIDVSCLLNIKNKGEGFAFSLSVTNNSGLIFESANYPNVALKDNLVGAGGKHKLFWSAIEGVEVINSSLKTDVFTFNPDNEVSSSIAIFFNSFFKSLGKFIVVLLTSDMYNNSNLY